MHAVDSDKLVDEMQNEGEGLLGPSKSFIAELMAEGEGGAPVLVGTQCRFMVIDFSDEILLVTKEYVPEEDDEKSIAVFEPEHASALPSMADIPEKVKEWASGATVGRAAFYSAREEQDLTPKAPATKKAATPKRITNASTDMAKLGRAPTSAHRRMHRRVESFLRSDQGMDSFKVSKAGRKFPQLVARIGELTESVTRLGLHGDQYTKTFVGAKTDGLGIRSP